MNHEILFLTGNEKKHAVAKKYFARTPFKVVKKTVECPEIQDVDVVKVVAFSVKYMAEELKQPVIKSDQGFYVEALQGFPGAYMHDVEKHLGTEGFKRLMCGIKNRKAKYVEALAYCEPGEEPIIFTSEKKGVIAEEPHGTNGYGIDFLFVLDGETETAAALSKEKLDAIYDFHLWPKLIAHLHNTKT